MSNVRQLRDKQPKARKLPSTWAFVDLGRIRSAGTGRGSIPNRSDYIPYSGFRKPAWTISPNYVTTVDRTGTRWRMGLRDYTLADLEAVQAANEVLPHSKSWGCAVIARTSTGTRTRHDWFPFMMLGALQASTEVKNSTSATGSVGPALTSKRNAT